MTNKTCIKCNRDKPISEFYEIKAYPGKHSSYCKECQNAVARERQIRVRGTEEGRRLHNSRARAFDQKKRDDRRAAGRPPAYGSSKFKRDSRNKLHLAIRNGEVKPNDNCNTCGHDFGKWKREAHHEDYSKPLDVEWLCSKCHGQRHAKYPETA